MRVEVVQSGDLVSCILECPLCTLFQTEVQSVGPVHGSIEAIPQQQLHSLHGATYCEF